MITAAPLIGAASALAAIHGTYSGSGKGFAITVGVKSGHVNKLDVSCGQGAQDAQGGRAGPPSPP